MKYSEYETVFSPARMNKYLVACNGNKAKALSLYRHNVKLCQKFYGLMNIFEVVLRNAINRHYVNFLQDDDWIRNQLKIGGMLEYAPQRNDVLRIIENLEKAGRYSNDRLVSSVSFGFWTYLFTKQPYHKGGNSLLKIFPMRQKGVGQRAIFNELQEIKTFRNRIAHQEAICFDSSGNLNLENIRSKYRLIQCYVGYLGLSTKHLFYGIDILPDSIIAKIMQL